MAFWGPVLGALGASLITGLFNKESQDSANEANVELWQRQAAYNSPIENMKRLEAAGLSPHLAYGQIAESKMSNPPTIQPVRYEQPRFNLADYQQIQNMHEQNKLVRETNRAAAAEADYKEYETKYLKDHGMLRNDTGAVRLFDRGTSVLSDKVQQFTRWMENENERYYREQQERQNREKENK